MAAFQAAIREINSLLVDPENFQDFVTFLNTDYGLDQALVDRFSMPNLVTRALTIDEFEYIVPILAEEGIIREGFKPPQDLIFRAP